MWTIRWTPFSRRLKSSVRRKVFSRFGGRGQDLGWGLAVGVVALAAFPPFSIPGAVFGFAALFFLMAESAPSPNHAFFRAFLAGLPFWALHVGWMRHVPVAGGVMPLLYAGVLLVVAAESALWGALAWIFRRVRPAWPASVLFAAGLWTLYEWIRARMPLAFPWSPLWEGGLATLPFLQILSFTGPFGWTFLAVLLSWGVARALRVGRGPALFLFSGAFYLWWNLGVRRLERPPEPGDTLRVAILQPAVLPTVIGDPTEWPRMQASYTRMLQDLPDDVDLLLFSESAFYGIYPYHRSTRDFVDSFLVAAGKPALFGDVWFDHRTPFNAALLLERPGDVRGVYRKRRLVPFGEYIPGERLFPVLKKINLGGGHYAPGRAADPVILVRPGGDTVRIGVLICYEGIFPDLARSTVQAGAQVLVNPTNDGWFGRSLGPREHFHLHRFRAMETGRAFVRVARTGISGIIYPTGEVGDTLGLMQEGLLVLDVPLYNTLTWYVRVGDVPWILLALLGLVWGVVRRSREEGS